MPRPPTSTSCGLVRPWTVDYLVKINDGLAIQHVIITITGTDDNPVFSAVTTDPHTDAEILDASNQDLAAIHGTLAVSDRGRWRHAHRIRRWLLGDRERWWHGTRCGRHRLAPSGALLLGSVIS